MSNDVYTLALRNALTEIGNACPEVKTSVLLDKEATIIAGDSKTPKDALEKVAESFMRAHAHTIEGLDALTIESTKGKVYISRVNDLYLTMITSKDIDMKYLATVARVLIPTVMKLLDSFGPTPLKPSILSHASDLEEELQGEIEESENNEIDEQEEAKQEPELPSSQLIVESFGGLLVRSDTVQISEDIMAQWEDLLDGKEIELVEVESFNGKTSQCKFKRVDDSKLENKAVIRIPEKLCNTLDIKKGELVRVKPIIS